MTAERQNRDMSIRSMCNLIRGHLARGRGRAARVALKSTRFPRRVQDSQNDLRCVIRLLRRYREQFPADDGTVKRALWRAVRAVTPPYVPGPAFDCLDVDNVKCELVATQGLVEAYASGRLSIVHRLLHYGYGEATEALDTLLNSGPYDGSLAPSALPETATRVLGETTSNFGTRPPIPVLRAAMTLGFVLGDPLHFERTHSFTQTHRPDLLPMLERLAGSIRDVLF
jgi:hypothetical protein